MIENKIKTDIIKILKMFKDVLQEVLEVDTTI